MAKYESMLTAVRAIAGMQGGMQGGAGSNDPSALSEQQRRIVAATFNVIRDREKLPADKFRDDVTTLEDLSVINRLATAHQEED